MEPGPKTCVPALSVGNPMTGKWVEVAPPSGPWRRDAVPTGPTMGRHLSLKYGADLHDDTTGSPHFKSSVIVVELSDYK